MPRPYPTNIGKLIAQGKPSKALAVRGNTDLAEQLRGLLAQVAQEGGQTNTGASVIGNEAMGPGKVWPMPGQVQNLLGPGGAKAPGVAGLVDEYASIAGPQGLAGAAEGASGWAGKLAGLAGKAKGPLGLLGLLMAAYGGAEFLYKEGPGARKEERMARLLQLQGGMGEWDRQQSIESEGQLSNRLVGLKQGSAAVQGQALGAEVQNQQDLARLMESQKDLLGQISEVRGPSPMELYLQLSRGG